MAVTYGFYNSVSNDRLYDAVQISKIFDGIIYDGVYSKVGDAFNVLASAPADLNVTVGSGRAWFNSTWTYNDSGLVIAIPQGHVAYPRIDSIVLKVNEETRINSIYRLPGPEESSPEPPVLTNTSTIHEYRLANIYVASGATTITQADITLLVGTGYTPFVTGPLSSISADAWLAQWEAEWDAWFNYIIGELDSEVAGNLQLQITAMRGDNNDPLITLVQLKTHDHDGGDGNQIPTNGILDSAITAAKIANRTRKFLVPVVYNSWEGSYVYGNYGTDLPFNTDVDVRGYFQIPEDFVSGMTVKAIVRPNASGTFYGNAYANYLTNGQGSPHSDSIVNTGVALTSGITSHIFSITLSTPSKGDHVAIRLSRLCGSYPSFDTIENYVYVMGWVVEYTADS